MTLDEMYAEMELYGFDDLEDSQKLMLLNEAYFDIVTREPWPFLEKTANITVSDGVTRITNNSLVSPQITDLNSVLSFTDTSHNVILIPERADVIEKNYKINNLNVYPERYYFSREANTTPNNDLDLFVYPAVQGSTSYRLYYTVIPTGVTDTGNDTDSNTFLIPKRHHSIIVYGALVKAFLVNDDPQAAMFQNMFESRYQQMRNDVWMKQYDRTDRIHVMTDNYDWNY